MPSNAWLKFKKNADDVRRLLEIHSDIGGKKPGKRHRLEVLNKSAIVLITAFWEAYCEDLASEALEHLVAQSPTASGLPTELKKLVAAEIKNDKHELAVWTLADDEWKAKVRSRLLGLRNERNFHFNTPKSHLIDAFFWKGLGLKDTSTSWYWKKMSVEQSKKKLDRYVALRGEIAHRGGSASSCKKAQVTDYFGHVNRLAARIGGRVFRFVRQTTGKRPW